MPSSTPIHTVELFPELDGHLHNLLRSLSREQWYRPTVCSQWCVKDVASHLLDGALRHLSLQRDGHVPTRVPSDLASNKALVEYLSRLNAEWTVATDRLSPQVITRLLEVTDPELWAMFRSMDPNARAMFPVAWAGEEESANWFEIAREYTERWHHQQQIWHAVGRPSPIMSRRLYHPVLEAFMRALPFTFREVVASEGTAVTIIVTGEAGGSWHAVRYPDGWQLDLEFSGSSAATVTYGSEVAWRVLTKRKDAATALKWFPSILLEGDEHLARRALEMVSIMA